MIVRKHLHRVGIVLAALLIGAPATAWDAAPAPVHIDVALGDVSINKIPYLIAADRGLYAKYGLDIHQFITSSAARVVERNGIHVPPENIGDGEQSAPLMIGGGAWLVAATAKAAAPTAPQRIIITTNENIVRDHIIARSGLHTVQDLKGKVLGAGIGNVPGYAAIVYLRHVRLDRDVRIDREASLEALKAGRVDAIMANLFTSAKAPALGFVDIDDVARYRLPEAGSGVLADPTWLKSHRDAASRFVQATADATELMKRDKQALAEVVGRWFGITDPAMIDTIFRMAQDMPAKPYPAVAGIREAVKVYDAPGLSGIKPEAFYDSSIVSNLDRAGKLPGSK